MDKQVNLIEIISRYSVIYLFYFFACFGFQNSTRTGINGNIHSPFKRITVGLITGREETLQFPGNL